MGAQTLQNFVVYVQPANAMEAIERSFILGETPDQVLSEKVPATKMLQEPTRHTGAAGQIKVQVPVTDEETEKPTIRALPQTKICQEESPFTPFTSEMSEDPTEVEVKAILAAGDRKLAFEVIPSKPREFNIKAKGIHRKQDEVPRSTMEVDQSTSVSMAGFYEESSAYVDNIVDRIINDIAGIEADLEVEIQEVSIDSNIKLQKIPIYEQPVGLESEETCHDHMQPSEGCVLGETEKKKKKKKTLRCHSSSRMQVRTTTNN